MGAQAGQTLTAHLAAQWASIAAAEACEAALRRATAQQEARQRALELELRALRTHLVPQLRHRRALRAAYEREHERERAALLRRRERVQEHMAQYLRDVQHRLDTAHLRAAEAQRRADGRAAAIEDLEDDIAEVLLGVGASDAAQVYREVLEFDEWNSVLDGGFRPGVYGGFGVGGGGGPGGVGAASATGAGGRDASASASTSAYPNAPSLMPLSPLSPMPPMPLEIADGYQDDGLGGRSPIDATGFSNSADFVDAVDPGITKGKGGETGEVSTNGKVVEKVLAIKGKIRENEIPRRAPKNEEPLQYRQLPPLPLPSSSSAHQVSEQERTPRPLKVQKLFKRTTVETGPSETGGKTKEVSPGKGKEPAHRLFKGKGKSPVRRHETVDTARPQEDKGVIAEGSNLYPEQFQGWDK